MKTTSLLLIIVLCVCVRSARAGNIYPIHVSDGSTAGDVDTLYFSGGALSIGAIAGGGRMGTLTISGGGGGGGGGGAATNIAATLTTGPNPGNAETNNLRMVNNLGFFTLWYDGGQGILNAPTVIQMNVGTDGNSTNVQAGLYGVRGNGNRYALLGRFGPDVVSWGFMTPPVLFSSGDYRSASLPGDFLLNSNQTAALFSRLMSAEGIAPTNVWFLNGQPFATNSYFGVSNASPSTLSITPFMAFGVPTLIFSNSASSGGATNLQAGLGIAFAGNAGSLSIGVNPSLVLTSGSPVSAIAGALNSSSTNTLADKSFVVATSNTLMQAIVEIAAGTNATVISPGNGILFLVGGGGTNIAIDPSVVVTQGAPYSALSGTLPTGALPANVARLDANQTWSGPQNFGTTTAFGGTMWVNGPMALSNNATITGNLAVNGSVNLALSNLLGQITIAQLPTNGINSSSWSGSVFSNGLLISAGTITPLTTITSATGGLGTFTISGGSATLNLSTGILTNGDAAAFQWNGTATVSNNATVTGSFHVDGALSAGTIVGLSTGTVASVNGLVSNVTITAAGAATINTSSGSSGGTITVSAPTVFASTNTSSVAPIFWDTKYGALRVSNVFGATFINTPDLSTTSNEVAALTDYFTSTSTSAWIQVNFSGAWTVVNSNNWLWIASSGESNANTRYLVKAIPNTNQSWRARALFQPITPGGGTSSYNAGMGLVTMDNTNSAVRLFTSYRASAGQPGMRGFAMSTPDQGAISDSSLSPADSASLYAFYGSNAQNALDSGGPSGFWLQMDYDGSSTQRYSFGWAKTSLPPHLNVFYTKTNQTVNPRYVGLSFLDADWTKPAFAIKAFIFEQP